MNDPAGRAKAVDSLRSLLERLGSPELTLPEAKALRQRFHKSWVRSFRIEIVHRCACNTRFVLHHGMLEVGRLEHFTILLISAKLIVRTLFLLIRRQTQTFSPRPAPFT